ncbi:hypothetical protein H6775_03410 [Candidatus Nomurabacteria bacterium]|nr:hypothetical protein [Candidatus Nomurabacteria bacterium]
MAGKKQKIEFKLGITKRGVKGKASFNFVFTDNGDVYITPRFKEKLYKSTKITLHPPNIEYPNNYQSFSFQKDSIPDLGESKRHIQQTKGDFDIGHGLHFRQSILIHSSILKRASMFNDTQTHVDIYLDKGETILDLTLLSSNKKFKGIPNRKQGFKKLFDVIIKDSVQFCLVFKGRKILSKELQELEEVSKKDIHDFDGIVTIGGNTKNGYPVITYLDKDYLSARAGSK